MCVLISTNSPKSSWNTNFITCFFTKGDSYSWLYWRSIDTNWIYLSSFVTAILLYLWNLCWNDLPHWIELFYWCQHLLHFCHGLLKMFYLYIYIKFWYLVLWQYLLEIFLLWTYLVAKFVSYSYDQLFVLLNTFSFNIILSPLEVCHSF